MYAPEASQLTRRRIRIMEQAERSAERKERLNQWVESDGGQKVLIGIAGLVVLATGAIGGLVGN